MRCLPIARVRGGIRHPNHRTRVDGLSLISLLLKEPVGMTEHQRSTHAWHDDTVIRLQLVDAEQVAFLAVFAVMVRMMKGEVEEELLTVRLKIVGHGCRMRWCLFVALITPRLASALRARNGDADHVL
jgi:hypothetical protein